MPESRGSASGQTRQFVTLVEDIRACTLCAEHLPLGPRPVLQVDPAARILVVGQAPGTAVHRSGVPFDDPSGDRLRLWMGIGKTEFYNPAKIALIPMGFCYPGKGKGGDLPPRPECAEKWRQRLLDHMQQVELTLVIGRYAIDWHLQPGKGKTLRDVVADWHRYWPSHLPLPHPSPRNTRWLRNNPWVESELIPNLQKQVARLM
ncbi:MAG: uracil-DNA glycosylase family protein [Pseudomonadota bacterium]